MRHIDTKVVTEGRQAFGHNTNTRLGERGNTFAKVRFTIIKYENEKKVGLSDY